MQPMGILNTLHPRRTDSWGFGHGSAAPVRGIVRLLMQRRINDSCDFVRANLSLRRRPDFNFPSLSICIADRERLYLVYIFCINVQHYRIYKLISRG